MKRLHVSLAFFLFCSLILISSIQIIPAQGSPNTNELTNINTQSTQITSSSTLTETTILSLEPDIIKVPYLEKDDGPQIVAIKLHIQNVQNLNRVFINMRLDSNILEPVAYEMESSFRQIVGGWSGSGFATGPNPTSHDFQLSTTYSGSSAMFIYYFRTLKVGTTEVNLTGTHLTDTEGETIQHETSGTTLEVVPFEIWANTTCANLIEKYNTLTTDFQTLNITYRNLLTNYTTLSSNYNNLSAKYDNLTLDYDTLKLKRYTLEQHLNTVNASYQTLLKDYDNLTKHNNDLNTNFTALDADYLTLTQQFQTLNTTYYELKQNYTQIVNDYENLQADYNTLKTEYEQTITTYTELKFDYESTALNTHLMYLFIATTITLLATTIYLANKKSRKT